MSAMKTRERIEPPADGGAPPTALPAAPDPIDEGPMRRELLRQIAQLEVQLSATVRGWTPTCAAPRRGPAMVATAQLETLRDELLSALHPPVAR